MLVYNTMKVICALSTNSSSIDRNVKIASVGYYDQNLNSNLSILYVCEILMICYFIYL
jgi:hypothetical protein